MPTLEHPLQPLLLKLQSLNELDEVDRAAVLALPFFERSIAAGHFVVREGDEPQRTCLLLSGLAYRQKVTGEGTRQILSIHIKGDLIDLQNSLLGRADHNVQMLTSGSIALIPVQAIPGSSPSLILPWGWQCGLKPWSTAPSFGNGS